MQYVTAKALMNGERISWYMGVVDWDANRQVMILAPIPFNFLFIWGRRLWWRLKGGTRDKALLTAYEQGYQDGRARHTRDTLLDYLNNAQLTISGILSDK